ncbi:HAD-like domain-containing protein [Chytridium lagenaria]|nr:HAD-like domain-containing protein [Chytridium lagenaria]
MPLDSIWSSIRSKFTPSDPSPSSTHRRSITRKTSLPTASLSLQPAQSGPVLFLDIDNCLYHKNTGIYTLMGDRIRAYFENLGLSPVVAEKLHRKYYIEYGLAVRGLVKHHKIDPVEYDKVVDGGLPLERLLKPDVEGARIWACTNANLPHATRVLKILGIYDLFEGITYCDYAEPDFTCKPERDFYLRTMMEANVTNLKDCYFVDDSSANVDGAKKLGWTTVHVADTFAVTDIHDLPKVLPRFWPNRDPAWTAP